MNKKQIENKVLLLLKERRARALDLAIKNKQKALSNPAFLQCENSLRSLEIDLAKATQQNVAALKSTQAALEKQKQELLQQMGMTPSDLTPKPTCPKCNDTGFVCGKQCSCFKNMVLYELLKNSGIEAKDLVGFDSFNTAVATDSAHKQALESYKNFLLNVAEKFPNQKPKNILVCGPTGTGKTFGAKCLTKEVLKKQETALFLSAFEFNSLLLKYHTSFVEDKNSIMESLTEPQLLVIDDLGTEPMLKNVTKEYLFNILCERTEKGKTTFITTNLGLQHILERYGERIFSRLTDKQKSVALQLLGTDLRHNK